MPSCGAQRGSLASAGLLPPLALYRRSCEAMPHAERISNPLPGPGCCVRCCSTRHAWSKKRVRSRACQCRFAAQAAERHQILTCSWVPRNASFARLCFWRHAGSRQLSGAAHASQLRPRTALTGPITPRWHAVRADLSPCYRQIDSDLAGHQPPRRPPPSGSCPGRVHTAQRRHRPGSHPGLRREGCVQRP